MASESSGDSDLSDDAFLNQISSKWGEEESELRQAIFFQFIKHDSNRHNSFRSEDRMSQYDRMLDRESIASQDQDDLLAPNRKSSDMSFQLHMRKSGHERNNQLNFDPNYNNRS